MSLATEPIDATGQHISHVWRRLRQCADPLFPVARRPLGRAAGRTVALMPQIPVVPVPVVPVPVVSPKPEKVG